MRRCRPGYRSGVPERARLVAVMSREALVRRPGPHVADGLVSHIERKPVDPDLAMQQWQGYVKALKDTGWEITEVAPAPELPDSMFIEDTLVVYGDVAVVTRPGAEERRSEVIAAERSVRDAGYRVVRIVQPGTLDGGDVLKFGGTVYVGQSGRTNAEGVRQLAEHLSPLGATVVPVPVTKVLHLKSALTALPDGTVIGYEPLVDDKDIYDRFLAVPEEVGSHVVLLEDNNLLMSSRAPETAAMLRDMGYGVACVDIGEFEKLEGCVTCLSVRMRGI
jgi:dimethylargininase